MCENSADDAQMEELRQGIKAIFNYKNISRHKYMALYTAVYNICTKSDRNTAHAFNSSSNSAPLNQNQNSQALAGSELYDQLQKFLEVQVKSVFDKSKGTVLSGGLGQTESTIEEDQIILREYNNEWKRFLFSKQVFNGVAAYLNRYWVKRVREEQPEKQVYEIKDLALIEWKRGLFDKVVEYLTPAILRLVHRDRKNDVCIDYELLASVRDSYVQLGLERENQFQQNSGTRTTAFQQQNSSLEESYLKVYKNQFEKKFLEQIDEFYHEESEKFLSEHNAVEYMKFAENRIEQENKRVESFLHSSSIEQVMKRTTDALVKEHLHKMHDEFKPLLEQWKTEDLCRMYKLTKKADGLDRMKELLKEYILKKGKDAIGEICKEAVDDPKLYVNKLVEIHEKHRKLLLDCFENDSTFRTALDKACENFINDNKITSTHGTNKSAELLARHCDALLKKGNNYTNINNDSNQTSFDKIMTIFEFLQDKDVFSKYYKNAMCKRLIGGTSIGNDQEELMLAKLKDKCGYEFVAKQQRMMQDIFNNKATNEDFNKYLQENNVITTSNMTVQVLSTGSWPINPQPIWQMNVPSVFQKCLENFEKFYQVRHNGRKLQWINDKHKIEVQAGCFKKPYTFTTSIFQASILLMFNDKLCYTVAEIETETGIKKSILDQIIALLLKVRLLQIDEPASIENSQLGENSQNLISQDNSTNSAQNSQQINNTQQSTSASSSTQISPTNKGNEAVLTTFEPTQRLKLFTEYKNKRQRININVPLRTEQKIEKESTSKAVEDDRKLEIQCCIVRVMKARKRLDHNALITETIEQLRHRFKPKVPMIKKGIDMLIEKEYMNRAEDDNGVYEYMA
jgi:cullin 1